MKTYQEINDRISSGKAVVLTAEEIIDYVDRKGVEAAAEEVSTDEAPADTKEATAAEASEDEAKATKAGA